MRERGVVYMGQYGTSGYAVAAKGYICDFIMRGIPVAWTPLKFDDSEMGDDNFFNIIAKSAIGRKLPSVSSIILHSTADLWPKYKTDNLASFKGRNIIGYTVWETNRLPEGWDKHINESVSEVWCPSNYNKTIFLDSGVTIPIRVVPHIFMKQVLPEREFVELRSCSGDSLKPDTDSYTFYNISEFNERKNILGLIRAYCKAFQPTDSVRLVLKIHYKGYTIDNLKYCLSKINGVLNEFPSHAPIALIADNLSDTMLLGLHSIGDCYVSLTRSEAFGLTIFDAHNYGKKIIVTNHGGQVEFLGSSHAGLVESSLVDVKDMEGFSHGYYMQGTQQWAEPNLDHAISLMRDAYTKR